MNYELFIARRIIRGGKSTFSGPAVRISIISVALGLAVMILSVAIVTGFQQQIRDKITGFGAHIQIAKFDDNNSLEYQPVQADPGMLNMISHLKEVKHVQVFATKAGIVQTEDQIQGIVLKGIGPDFDWGFFRDKMVNGSTFRVSNEAISDSVIISQRLAGMLNLKTGDPLRTYFIIDNQARGRRFVIAGIYNTGLEDFDKMYVFGDIAQIRKLNGWDSTQVSGFEITVKNFQKLDQVNKEVYNKIGYDMNARTIREIYPQLFDWLDLQDMNVVIILALMIAVSVIAMISTLLILILERTGMIGLLKALGAGNFSVRKIFIYNAVYIIGLGLLWGNLAGIGLSLLQKATGVIKLPEESYFMSVVPVNLQLWHVALLNLGTLVVCTAMLIIPSLIITRITPVKAIRMD